MADLTDSRTQQLLENERKLQQTRSRLLDATRTALETEETGFQVLSDLAQQREQLSRVSNQVDETNSNITQSRQLMMRMSRRAFIKRTALWMMLAVLLITLFLVVYFLWIKN
mmetsp:Transcript_72890/g.152183  ORF Transcript_72890/g.152183 Transcript_72890/m.152183 type:complete len:112 (-) Transcript_72890:53-388(-)|eukprot:CAMPEP_0206511782 /NCGR_PEP_ID=MMETSP0324_2-20121206/60475_1 /ASSEMBLY_ACC=CAM_ASM_000836 /TAXON_ID=2866 /ORGANISM="Crypthecodinium cohnii, Strain Seligo" /LENGTH=111 /DNA_ID=CAMNT_0054003587 /DNA_START=58 /DNA_END=393 /DNA_ORIENTATION=-